MKAVEVVSDPGDRLAYTLRPNLPVLGPKFGAEVGKVRAALAAADAAEVAAAMRAARPVELGGYTLAATDILVTVQPTEGYAAAEEAGYAAILDTRVTEELAREGLAREVVRHLQDLRREAGLDVSDRIHVTYVGDDALLAAFEAHRDTIAGETLALTTIQGDPPDEATAFRGDLDGVSATLSVRKA